MPIGQRHLFSWLHLSDLHFGHGDTSYGWNQKTVLSLLERDVEQALKDWPELPPPQGILVTGDIAFSGGKQGANEYRDADEFLRRLTKLLGLPQDKVFLVPGNHDVERDVAKNLVNEVRTNPGAIDTILDSPTQRGALFDRQLNYKRFADGFGARNLPGWSEIINVSNFGEISVVGLNTAMISNDDHDQGQLVMAGEQRHLLSTVEGRVRLLMTHHPFEEDWLRDQAVLQSIAQQHLTVHLCGHVHDARVNLV